MFNKYDIDLSDSSTVSVDPTGLSSIQEVAQTLNNGLDVNGAHIILERKDYSHLAVIHL